MKMSLMVGAPEFWSALEQDIRAASSSVLVQALTFEGDAAGTALARALFSRPDLDRRVLVDSFTRFVQKDRFLYSPGALADPALRSARRQTTRMIAGLRAAGVDVRFTNPVGPLMQRVAARNHKKLVIVDGRIAYIGGINFSDHNFAWHDLMLRIECDAAAEFLTRDFVATQERRPVYRNARFDRVELHCMDGRSNEKAFERIRELIADARESIFVESPYLSFPVCGWLRDAVRRGTRVTVLSPAQNNREFLRHYITWEAARSGFDLRLYQGMTHLKAMLVDGAALVLGSTNFDYLSYRTQEEIFAVVDDEPLIADFADRIMQPDLARSAAPAHGVTDVRGRFLDWQLRLAGNMATGLAKSS